MLRIKDKSLQLTKKAHKLQVLNSATEANIFESEEILYIYRGAVATFPLSGSLLSSMLNEYSGSLTESFNSVCKNYGVEPWQVSALSRLYPLFAEFLQDVDTARAVELEHKSVDVYNMSVDEQISLITDEEGKTSSAIVTHLRNRSVQLLQSARLLNKSRHDAAKTDGTTININNSNSVDNSESMPSSLEDVHGLDITALSEISNPSEM